MPLEHVCIWQNKGWKHITALEAALKHPGGTVSAGSRLFMCELCGQYVTLTDEGAYVRHFRHSSAEAQKNCPDRSASTYSPLTYNCHEYELPIRICNPTSPSFSFEIGFVRVPTSLLGTGTKVNIHGNAFNSKHMVYSYERFLSECITYLRLPDDFSNVYTITTTPNSTALSRFWPAKVPGIDPSGTVFDAVTRKKLVYDSDVIIGHKYYVVTTNHLRQQPFVQVQKVSSRYVSYRSWNVYLVSATDYDKSSAKFFLDLHCRLTDCPASIQPVWPAYVESPYAIRHNHSDVTVYVSVSETGSANVFPHAPVSRCRVENGYVLNIPCNDRQQLISAGRTRTLQYMYFWRESLEHTPAVPEVQVKDVDSNVITQGVNNAIPKKNTLTINAAYDGTVIIRVKGSVIEKRVMKANLSVVIDNITWGMSISVLVGLDQIWLAAFEKSRTNTYFDEEIFVSKLSDCRKNMMPAPHSLGSMAARLKDYPQIRSWLLLCIRKQMISNEALRMLQDFIPTIHTN